ncbi:MAG: ATP-binding cassette domain-containing protein [Proteobacteria bacterium]|nr:ATP-binding cassette domain-containing protein [Pseudomonadota bacterium]
MIKLNDIQVIFNQGTQLENHVLKGINLTIEKGEFVTIIGGNGAGKSTLMNILAGDLLPHQGSLFIENKDITTWPTEKRSPLVARIFQDPMLGTFSELTIEENLSLAHQRGKRRGFALSTSGALRQKFREALSVLNMNLENRLLDKVSSLSGGQRQALSLVMATLQECELLLLDEHTAALDPKIANTIMEITNNIVKARKLTTLMITHSMSQALHYGSRTIMLYHGEVVRDMTGDTRKSLSTENLLAFFEV